jgi:hypothetical protein
MDVSTLQIGQDVFIYGKGKGVWGKVEELTTSGATVRLDPFYFGADYLVAFDLEGSWVGQESMKLYLDYRGAGLA